MLDIITEIFGLWTPLINRGNKIHTRYVGRMVILASILAIIMVVLNQFDATRGINLLVSFLAAVLVVIIATRAEAMAAILAAGFISGVARTPETIPQEIESLFKKYLKTCCEVLLWVSVAALFLGTLSFAGSLGALFLIVAALMVIKLAAYCWGFGFSLYKRVIYLYAIAIFIAGLCLMVSSETWSIVSVKYTGCDIPGYFKTSPVDKAKAQIIEEDRRHRERQDLAFLSEVNPKVKRGEKLTPYEQDRYNKLMTPGWLRFMKESAQTEPEKSTQSSSPAVPRNKATRLLPQNKIIIDSRGRTTYNVYIDLEPGTYKFPYANVYTLKPDQLWQKETTWLKLDHFQKGLHIVSLQEIFIDRIK